MGKIQNGPQWDWALFYGGRVVGCWLSDMHNCGLSTTKERDAFKRNLFDLRVQTFFQLVKHSSLPFAW